MIDELIGLADYLDRKGHKVAAEMIDDIIKSAAAEAPRNIIGKLTLAVESLRQIADPLQYDDEELYNELTAISNLLVEVLNVLNGV